MGHGHQHQHRHEHEHDWQGFADLLELEAAMVVPIVDATLARLLAAHEGTVVVADVGCGPGALAVHLARRHRSVSVVALDTSEGLLQRARERAAAAGVGDRISTVRADLEDDLPPIAPVDVVLASMVLHHVVDLVGALQRLRQVLAPRGSLVVIEFDATPSLRSVHLDPADVDAWAQLQSAGAAARNEHLGLDPLAIDWASRLAEAGFVDVVDEVRIAEHPLRDEATTRWFHESTERGLTMVGDRLSAAVAARVAGLGTADGTTVDASVLIARRVLVARA